jgi:hypothetical protein
MLFQLESLTMPRIEPAVFLSDQGPVSELDDVERQHVYGRDDRQTGLPGIWRDLLARPPARSARIDDEFTRHLPRLFNAIGVSAPQSHLRYGDDWRLVGKPLVLRGRTRASDTVPRRPNRRRPMRFC